MPAQDFDEADVVFAMALATHGQEVVPVVGSAILSFKNAMGVKQFVLVFPAKIAYLVEVFAALLY
jgi:hypothetical protein